MDGAFSTSPAYFDQVFIIQAIHHRSCVPVVYALLPDRKAPNYLYLFSVLFDQTKTFNRKLDPVNIMTDFELDLTGSVDCLFSNYINNLMIRNAIKQTMALALIPPLYVQELNDDKREDISGLLHYFNDHWASQVSTWNVYEIPD
ncbi:unnamed protein product [Adineta steineri]|uniref:MULE transposase domain-containing protein n=1 Tax=Adineta steineri TaxID=433720 RepID=A0A819U2E7_9BILA|nr:unnamed protein product [Adineta steineri]